jgi:hypothetical protein
MKYKIIPEVLTLLLVLSVAALAQTAEQPRMVIKSTEYNFGEIKKGKVVEYAFVFKNEGKADLEIKAVVPACGCTASEYTKFVPSGQEGKIQLTVNTSAFNGPISKTADVYTNDARLERLTLMVSGVVTTDEAPPKGQHVGPFVIGPAPRWSARVPHGLNTNGVIAITNMTAQPIKIANVESGGQVFTYSFHALEDGKRYSLNFTSVNGLSTGSHKQLVKLETDSKEMPVIELELEAVVVPAVTVSPNTLSFENVPISDPEVEVPLISKFLWVRLGRGAGLEVTSATSDLPFVKVKVESTDNNGQSVLLRVGFNAKPPKGTHTGVVRIQTNNSELKETEIPITLTAQ